MRFWIDFHVENCRPASIWTKISFFYLNLPEINCIENSFLRIFSNFENRLNRQNTYAQKVDYYKTSLLKKKVENLENISRNIRGSVQKLMFFAKKIRDKT